MSENNDGFAICDFDGYAFAIAVSFVAAQNAARGLRRPKPRRNLGIGVRGYLTDIAGGGSAASK
jgi:hypothetical protein